MADDEDQLPESQIGRAQWLADELVLCGHEEISAMEYAQVGGPVSQGRLELAAANEI
jgi:hypothetical protein